MDPSLPPPPDTNNAPRFLIPCGFLALIALVLCVTRIYTRLRPHPHLTPDDYLIGIAEIFSIAGFFSSVGAASNGWGHISFYVSPENRESALKCSFAAQFFWILAIALVRISLACSLLRFSVSKLWKGSLWTMITVQILISLGWLIHLFFSCSPLHAFWKPVETIVCWDPNFTITFAWVSAGLLTAMDLFLALMPIRLIRTLSRPLPEKILIACLMGMGLLATFIAAFKMTTFKTNHLGDPLSTTPWSSMWAKLEEQVGIIAACLPCLKSPGERLLRRFGLLSTPARMSPTKPSFVAPANEGNLSLSPVDWRRGPTGEPATLNSKQSSTGLVSLAGTEWTGETLDIEQGKAPKGSVRSIGTHRTNSSADDIV